MDWIKLADAVGPLIAFLIFMVFVSYLVLSRVTKTMSHGLDQQWKIFKGISDEQSQISITLKDICRDQFEFAKALGANENNMFKLNESVNLLVRSMADNQKSIAELIELTKDEVSQIRRLSAKGGVNV